MSGERSAGFAVEGSMDVQELHKDLGRKYRNVGSRVEQIWRAFTPKQRETCLRESTGDGKVLKHSLDPGLSGLRDFIPEYNLKDMTSASDHFLTIFKFRATEPLYSQLYEGVRGMPGDRQAVERAFRRSAHNYRGEKMLFLEGQYYGQSFQGTGAEGVRSLTEMAERFGGAILPRAEGEMILVRQQYILQFMNHLVEEILGLDSETRAKTAPAKKTNKALETAVSNLSIEPQPLKSSFSDVLGQAVEQHEALFDYLDLLRSEPVVLDRTVNMRYYSRPELVPDERGRVLPLLQDRHLSVAFFEAVNAAVRNIAIWEHVLRLLRLLEDLNDKIKRPIIVQELSNTCHLEYRRAQETFKRQTSVSLGVASKRFRRITTGGEQGVSKVTMKGQPSDYTVSDPQVHYILRLCHPDTSPAAAVQWIQKLDDHNALHKDDRDKLTDVESTALGDLAIIVSFMHTLSTTIALAPMSRKSGLLFTSRLNDLDGELNRLKPNVDLGDYVIPMSNLLEPGVATGALQAMDGMIGETTGASLGSLYEDLVQTSLDDLDRLCAESKAKIEAKNNKTTYVPLPSQPAPTADTRVASRKEKEKTRPPTSTGYSITAPPRPEPPLPTEPPPRLKVKASTASTFRALFDKSEARGAIAWTDFEAAMANLGFSVTPKGGSIYTFNPPESVGPRPITLHRPHVSEIEGYKLLILARRLQRVYRWEADTFEVVSAGDAE